MEFHYDGPGLLELLFIVYYVVAWIAKNTPEKEKEETLEISRLIRKHGQANVITFACLSGIIGTFLFTTLGWVYTGILVLSELLMELVTGRFRNDR